MAASSAGSRASGGTICLQPPAVGQKSTSAANFDYRLPRIRRKKRAASMKLKQRSLDPRKKDVSRSLRGAALGFDESVLAVAPEVERADAHEPIIDQRHLTDIPAAAPYISRRYTCRRNIHVLAFSSVSPLRTPSAPPSVLAHVCMAWRVTAPTVW